MPSYNLALWLAPVGEVIRVKRLAIKEPIEYLANLVHEHQMRLPKQFVKAAFEERKTISYRSRRLSSRIGSRYIPRPAHGVSIRDALAIDARLEIELWELDAFFDLLEWDARQLAIGIRRTNLFPMFGGVAMITVVEALVGYSFILSFHRWGGIIVGKGSLLFLPQYPCNH